MKNIFLIISLCCTAIFFHSCQNDKFEDFEREVVENNSSPANFLTRTCGTEDHMEKLLSDPTYRRTHEQKLERAEAMRFTAQPRTGNAVVLPVAVHFQGVNNAATPQCLIDLANEQIKVLNDDFKGINADITKWTNTAAASFPGISNGTANIEFCLATKNHPNGFNLTNGQPAVTINQTTGDQNNQWAGYLNIFVQFGTGVLGYSPLGGSGNGDGVVIEASAFGAGKVCGNAGASQAPYNLGRTTTHEVGHYLLLDHIWGGGCGQDDAVADTPDSQSSHYGCPNLGVSTCGSTDMHMNYMDYTDDACMYMFSAGQATRSENYIASSLQNLVTKAATVCSGTTPPPPPTDTDGDGVPDTTDNCPNDANADQADADGDGIGDVCDTSNPPVDTDGDGVPDATDNCPNDANADQADADGDGIGDVCDTSNPPPPPPGTCTMEEITIDIILDDYGSETKWKLKDSNGSVVASGGPFQDGLDGTVITEVLCLPAGCYKLILKDSYGDGMCCDYGNGGAEVYDAYDYLIGYSDGYFGTRDVMRFCVGPNYRQAAPTPNERDEKRVGRGAKAKRKTASVK